MQLWQELQWQPWAAGMPKKQQPFCKTVANTALMEWWQTFEVMWQGGFDIDRQSLIMDKNQIDIHRLINK